MARKTKIVKLSLPQNIYAQLGELADQMGISKSEFLRKALKQYVASEMRWQRIRKWGDETAKRLNIEDEDDVDRIIHDFRQEKV
jgi:metal-responsive CopG/Arc/MetJ family transcriptional regulator